MIKPKVLILGLICIFIFAYCDSPADPEIVYILNPEPAKPQWPHINYFIATPSEILLGESSTLSWDVSYADKVVVSPAISESLCVGQTSCIGTAEVSPTRTTAYDLWAKNNNGQVHRVCSVYVTETEESAQCD